MTNVLQIVLKSLIKKVIEVKYNSRQRNHITDLIRAGYTGFSQATLDTVILALIFCNMISCIATGLRNSHRKCQPTEK